MRIVEITDRPSIALNNEENELFEYIQLHQSIEKAKLDDRQQYLVNHLVNKDLVVRKIKDGKVFYNISSRV